MMKKILIAGLLLASLTLQAQTFGWAKSFGGTSSEHGVSVAVDDAGNVYTTGFFYETCDFDPGPETFNITSIGYDDIFIQKMDALGNFLWAKSFRSTS